MITQMGADVLQASHEHASAAVSQGVLEILTQTMKAQEAAYRRMFHQVFARCPTQDEWQSALKAAAAHFHSGGRTSALIDLVHLHVQA